MGWIYFNLQLKMQTMQPLSHLESFVKSAECGSFSAAARLMGLTPAAVSKNVGRLETGLGVRLFQRSTRRLTLTEGGQRLLAQISPPLTALADAVDHAAEAEQQPAGTLKVSMGQAFGRAYLVPLLTDPPALGALAAHATAAGARDADERLDDIVLAVALR